MDSEIDFPSKILENAVIEISQLPGIGKRTALRLALHMLKQPEVKIDSLADSIKNLRKNINFCSECYNMTYLYLEGEPDDRKLIHYCKACQKKELFTILGTLNIIFFVVCSSSGNQSK